MRQSLNLLKIPKQWLVLLGAASVLLGLLLYTAAEPVGPKVIYSHTHEFGGNVAPLMRNDSKGKITLLALNATQPNENWKGYVGNLTGKLVLDDYENYTLFDWPLDSVNGEVFATRGSSVDWANVVCANSVHVAAEQAVMHHFPSREDTINKTFSKKNHPEFYVGYKRFLQDQCNYTLYTYENGAPGSNFPELLLYDGTNSRLIYTAILSHATVGYNGRPHDFQMIVAEDSTKAANTAYYFYVEVGG